MMRRRNSFADRTARFRSPRPRRRLILFSAAFALFLATLITLQARAQDAVPPPPPPDAPAADTAPAPGQNDVRAVRIGDVKGQVQVFENGQLAFPQAQPNMPAVEGMRFVTGENGRLELQFEDGSVARLAPNSSIRLSELRRNADGSPVTHLDALTGLTYYELLAGSNPIAVSFDGNIVTPDQDSTFRIALDPTPNELAVMQGIVHIDDGGGVSMDLHTGHTLQVTPGQAGAFTVADSVQPNSWDQWNADRDRTLAELAASTTPGSADSGNAAWNDLDSYGSWYDVPGYGAAWAPSGVGPSWDPFGSGYWGYYPSFGYTWISGYPWGWWPYHCGMWNYVGSWGWLWMPGGCGGGGFYGVRWRPVVPIYHAPPGYLPPMRPRHGPGPHPHPVPLVPVHRGNGHIHPIRIADGGPRPMPRPLAWNGRLIQPLAPGSHPMPGRLPRGSSAAPGDHRNSGIVPMPVRGRGIEQPGGNPGGIYAPRPLPGHPLPNPGDHRIVMPRPEGHPLPAPRMEAPRPAPRPAPHSSAPRPAPHVSAPRAAPRPEPHNPGGAHVSEPHPHR